MSFEPLDWTITRSTGAIRYVGADHDGTVGSNGRTTPTYATVIELHRALQDFADDASSAGDDQLDITDDNPSERSTDNIITLLGDYDIDDTAAEHLYDGSIIQGTGATRVIYDGIVNFGNVEAIQIIQNGAVLADDWWNVSGGGLNADANAGISHRFMIKTVNNNSDIDGRRLIGTSRAYGRTYSEFSINGTSRGNNVLALADATDLNNATAAGTVATYSSITKTEGYTSAVDIDPTVATEEYYVVWDKGTQTINDLYEYTKYVTRDGTAETLFGLSGELFRGVTHQVAYSSLAGGTFTEGSSVTINASTAQILADDGSGVMWVQLLTGTAPASSDSITQGGVTATAGTVTERTIPNVILGQSTGSAIIGAYGVALDPGATASDQFFDLSNQTINPPNNVTFSVTGVITDEDRILVGPAINGTDLELNQLASATAVSAGAVPSTFSVATAIPSDTPNAGTIRVEDDSGFYVLVTYTGFSGTNFTGCTGTFANASASGNDVFISYIDKDATATAIAIGSLVEGTQYVISATGTGANWTSIGASSDAVGTVFTKNATAGTGTGAEAKPYVTQVSFTSVYSSDRDLVVKVRDGGTSPIKEFITASTLGSNGGSVAAIRTSDA